MITKEIALTLQKGQIIYSRTWRNSDGTPQRFRVNDKVKTWKRRPLEFALPVKRGLFEYGYVDEWNGVDFTTSETEAACSA